MKRFSLLIITACFCCLAARSAGNAEQTVRNLIERVTPGYASQYKLEIIKPAAGKDVYEIDSNGKKIVLRGNNAVSLTSDAMRMYLGLAIN